MFLHPFTIIATSLSSDSVVKNPPSMQEIHAEDMGSILGSGISPGRGNGNPLQYSCLENLIDRLVGYGP